MIKYLIINFIIIYGFINHQPGKKLILKEMSTQYETITLGGGCFWCTEAIFEKVKGVQSVISGYSGGFTKNPSYREVCSGNTGHAEVVQIQFDPEVIDLNEILDIFFKTHDPTSLDRQGADTGTQYRSVIFYHNPVQKVAAEEKIEELYFSGTFKNPIVTRVETLTVFYKAEDYHQDYFANNPDAAYCIYVIDPKMDKLRKNFSLMLK